MSWCVVNSFFFLQGAGLFDVHDWVLTYSCEFVMCCTYVFKYLTLIITLWGQQILWLLSYIPPFPLEECFSDTPYKILIYFLFADTYAPFGLMRNIFFLWNMDIFEMIYIPKENTIVA